MISARAEPDRQRCAAEENESPASCANADRSNSVALREVPRPWEKRPWRLLWS